MPHWKDAKRFLKVSFILLQVKIQYLTFDKEILMRAKDFTVYQNDIEGKKVTCNGTALIDGEIGNFTSEILLTASSQTSHIYRANNSRLHGKYVPNVSGGAWCAASNTQNQWIQVSNLR